MGALALCGSRHLLPIPRVNKPPTRPSGTSAKAKFMKWAWDSIVRLSGEDGEDIESEDQEFAGAKQFVLTDATHPHYFVCRRCSVSAEGTLTIGHNDVKIIKPFHLRQSEFDRDELDPGDTYDVKTETWDAETEVFDSFTQKFTYEYKSSSFRIATDQTNPNSDFWTTEAQTIIPRWVPAVLLDDSVLGSLPVALTPIRTDTVAPTIIYAVHCGGLGANVTQGNDETLRISLLALNDGWAWAKAAKAGEEVL